MEIAKYLINIIRKNLILLIVLIALFGIVGFVHFNFQKKTYVSHFTCSKGGTDYELFSDLIHFNSYTTNEFELSEEKLNEIKTQLGAFSVSYLEGSQNSINFTLVSTNPGADHSLAQNNVLELLNADIYLSNALERDRNLLKVKSDYLSDKLALIDSTENIGANSLDAYTLFEMKSEIDDELNAAGKFDLIKPVGQASEKSKPLMIFVVLYEILALLLFFVVSNLLSLRKPS